MAAFGTTAQASFNPTEVLEGRAHSGAHQAKEGDGAQGSPVPFAGLWRRRKKRREDVTGSSTGMDVSVREPSPPGGRLPGQRGQSILCNAMHHDRAASNSESYRTIMGTVRPGPGHASPSLKIVRATETLSPLSVSPRREEQGPESHCLAYRFHLAAM